MKSNYEKNSISLTGAVSMGTGVMIGAGIFALTGQIAELAGPWFPVSFIAGAVVTSFSAYTYIKMSNAYPSAGGIAMILQKAYGPGAIAAAASLLMALSMVINESLVARTFGTYALRPFDSVADGSILVPVLGVSLIVFAYVVNASGNKSVGLLSLIMALLKVLGIAVFGLSALWVSGFNFDPSSSNDPSLPVEGFLASVALSILAFKGFTTITNSGAELIEPRKNVGRAIIFSIGICISVYLLVAFALGSSLSLNEIIAAKDYSLAEAAEPLFGSIGFYMTIGLALVATASGLLASVFAVSRMLAMLTDMKMIPHRHFGMSGDIKDHTLVYTVVVAAILTIFLDLSRIASLGAFFYLVMDILIHWGVFRKLRHEIGAKAWVLVTAISLDVIIIGMFGAYKLQTDPLIVAIAVFSIILVFILQRIYLKAWMKLDADEEHAHS